MITAPNIYQDIATRTGGDIYIGVVGPVRTGKSTFIKKFIRSFSNQLATKFRPCLINGEFKVTIILIDKWLYSLDNLAHHASKLIVFFRWSKAHLW